MIDFKSFRRQNFPNQEAAAKYFGCKQSFISQIETQKSVLPPDFISKIKSDDSLDKSMISEEDYNNQPINSTIEEPETLYGTTSVPNVVMEILKNQSESLLKKDSQMEELIILLKNQLLK